MRVLITGAAGQDGTILSTMLEREGIDVVALVKPDTDVEPFTRYAPSAQVCEVDLADDREMVAAITEHAPHQIFNFGGISSIMESVNHPELTHQVNVVAVEAILEGIRQVSARTSVRPRFLAAASGTIFEGVDRSPQTETMIPEPQTPYAKSKAQVRDMLRVARDEHGVFAVSAILYNHESPLRGPGFVTRKISMAVARIAAGLQAQLELGDIEVARDWGWAPDYVTGMRLMLQADAPKDFILATGISHRLSFFVAKAFAAAGIEDWRSYVISTSDNSRPVDSNLLVGDSRAAYVDLGWRHTVDFDSMAAAMVKYDMALLEDPDLLWMDF
jgi:GDPmannose 4,6-dehydratase